MISNSEDILKSVLSKIQDVPVEKVKSEAIKKKKDDKVFSNNSGLKLTNVEVEAAAWASLPKSKEIKKKSDLSMWSTHDFFYYTKQLYFDKYKKKLDLRIGGSSLELSKIKDKLLDIFGYYTNLILKDYIDFFFKFYIDKYRKKTNGFYFSWLKDDIPLKSFVDTYDYESSFKKRIDIDNKENHILTDDEFQAAFKNSYSSLVVNYGVVLSVNWLINKKNMSLNDAVKCVFKASKDVAQMGEIEMIKKSTEAFSPYPSWLGFKKPNLIFNKIKEGESVSVEFLDNVDNEKQFIFIRTR